MTLQRKNNKVESGFLLALQSPIEYQKEKSGAGSSSSLTRNRSSSGNRPAASSHSRPSSAVGLGDKELERGRSQMKVSTSNGGSSCFDSRVSPCSLNTHDGEVPGKLTHTIFILCQLLRILSMCVIASLIDGSECLRNFQNF